MTGIFAAVDLGATNLRVALVDLAGPRILERLAVPTPDRPEDTAAALVQLAQGLRIESGVIGVAAAPEIDAAGIVTRWPNRPAYVGARVFHLLEAKGLRLHTVDDGLAACIAEDHGTPPGAATVYLGLGTGVAGGAVIDGSPLAGAHRAAMDIGHLFVREASGQACPCGRSGCLQMVASGRALERACHQQGARIDEFAAAFIAGRDDTRLLLDSMARALAQAIAAVICIIDPARIVIGGALASRVLVQAINRELEALGMRGAAREATFGGEGTLIGAALHAARQASSAAGKT